MSAVTLCTAATLHGRCTRTSVSASPNVTAVMTWPPQRLPCDTQWASAVSALHCVATAQAALAKLPYYAEVHPSRKTREIYALRRFRF